MKFDMTYYVKLIDTTENLYNKQYDIVNNAQVYREKMIVHKFIVRVI